MQYFGEAFGFRAIGLKSLVIHIYEIEESSEMFLLTF